jgi:hypothetical protein
MQWKRTRLGLAAALCLAAGATAPARADVTITVTPSVAPNAFGSPSYGTYVSNAVYALENGLSSYGDPNSPSYYQALSNGAQITAGQNLVSGFSSWDGTADPGTVFGPAYANELGNRVLFGLTILGNGQQFSISQLSFTETSNDPSNAMGFTFAAGSYNYSNEYVGVIYGAGGAADIADYTYVTSGPNTQLVDALYGRGSGNAFAVYSTDPGTTIQDKLNNALAGIPNMTLTGTYSLIDTPGSQINTFAMSLGYVNVAAVPEPSTLISTGTGVVLALAYARRRRRRAAA